MMNSTLRRRIAKVPDEPGVYRWLSKDKELLYVGKAKSLRKRMQSYVREGVKHSPWVEIMVKHIADFEVTIVRSELEAFILESNLIKEFRPKYNIMLKDDKGYVYVRITKKDAYPMLEVVRRIADDHATYFGPFTTGSKNLENTLSMLDQIVHFKACRKSIEQLNFHYSKNAAQQGYSLAISETPSSILGAPLPGRGSSPCLDHQIGKCNGLCIGLLTEEEYRSRIDLVERFLRGNYSDIKRRAEELMKLAAAEKKFERAAKLRDTLRFIGELEAKQIISDSSGEHTDIVGIALMRGKIQVVLLKVRGGKMIDQLSFALAGEAEDAADALLQFLPQYYSATQDIPDTIIVSDPLPDAFVFLEWLREKRGKTVRLHVPARGKKSKLLEMAERNAQEKVEQQFASWEAEGRKLEQALTELQTLLHLPTLPKRIEGYDISHLGGTATVGSMVAFVNGKAKREHYRSFNMKTVAHGEVDDYKSLAEVLRRRLKYLTEDVKVAVNRLAADGITIGKAKKAEQKIIEEISKKNSNDIGSDGIKYGDYIVARSGDDIIGFCRLFEYPEKILCIRSLWVDEKHRDHRLGELLVQLHLKRITKGKVYVHISKESLLEYYGELGFQPINTPPSILQKKLDDWSKNHPGKPAGQILVWIASKQKTDDSFTSRPDLLLIDGGKGQLSTVVDVLKDMQLSIPVAGLAKREEEIFLPSQPDPLLVKEGSEARFMLQRLRDEAHRFANDRRERRLLATMTASKLDQVPGIGEATKKELLKKFGSVDAVLTARDEELREILSERQVEELRKAR